MTSAANLDKGLMEALELWMLELRIVEAEEVVHDDVAGKGGKGVREIQGLFTGFELLHTNAESVDMTVNYVDEVED